MNSGTKEDESFPPHSFLRSAFLWLQDVVNGPHRCDLGMNYMLRNQINRRSWEKGTVQR